jgi:hypothetical protein
MVVSVAMNVSRNVILFARRFRLSHSRGEEPGLLLKAKFWKRTPGLLGYAGRGVDDRAILTQDSVG